MILTKPVDSNKYSVASVSLQSIKQGGIDESRSVTDSHAPGNLGRLARKMERIREMSFLAKRNLEQQSNKTLDASGSRIATKGGSLLARSRQSMPELLSKKLRFASKNATQGTEIERESKYSVLNIKFGETESNTVSRREKQRKEYTGNLQAFNVESRYGHDEIKQTEETERVDEHASKLGDD